MKVIVKRFYYLNKEEIALVRRWMKDNNTSYRKLGKELGVSGSYLHDMIHNRRSVNEKLLEYFASKGLSFKWEKD